MEEAGIKQRRAAAERMRGMFADLAPGRSLVNELIAERLAEARREDREDRQRLSQARRSPQERQG
jgi:hypothetical protein